MSNKILPENTPAFPSVYGQKYGMSLRDYFASKAMNALYSGRNVLSVEIDDLIEDAKKFYMIADAMLEVRDKQKNNNQIKIK